MLRGADRVLGANDLVMLLLERVQFGVQLCIAQLNVFLEKLEDLHDLVVPLLGVLLLEVDCKCEWNDVVDVDLSLFAVGFDVEEQLILGCQR